MSKSFKKIKGQTPMEYRRDKLAKIRIAGHPHNMTLTNNKHNFTAKRRKPTGKTEQETEP